MHLGKAELRSRIFALRDALPEATRAAYSRAITAKIVGRREFETSQTVMMYSSFASEFDASGFARVAMEAGKTLVFPRVDRARHCLELYRISALERDFVTGVWGIREPDPQRCSAVTPSELDFVLVPGLAFDRQGGRVGYGKGYYDRLLATCTEQGHRPRAVAAAFDLQVVDLVPMEPHDVAIDAVVTECDGFLSFLNDD